MAKFLLFFVLALFTFHGVSKAGLASSYDMPDTGIASNTVIDIIEHRGGIWLATGKGVNFSLDSGRTWLIYDQTNGLRKDDISALCSVGDRLWVATNYDTLVGKDIVSASDGLTYTDNLGELWTRIKFGTDGLNIPRVLGGNRTIYDLTGFDDRANNRNWLFASAFAGGLLASQDGGIHWRRIFCSLADSLNFFNDNVELDLRNRYFSCAIDSSHGDTVHLWAGTAGGVVDYVYRSRRSKLFSARLNRMALCAPCANDTGVLYLGGDKGFSRARTVGEPFISRGTADGLPGEYITALVNFGGKLFVGTTADSARGVSTGLAVSTDDGDSFTDSRLDSVMGSNRQVADFASIGHRLYMAGGEGGLLVTTDSGRTWGKVFIDSGSVAVNRRNVVNALDALADTLRVGTDSGLVTLYFDPAGTVDSSSFKVFAEDRTSPKFSSTKVVRIRTQRYGLDIMSGHYDSLAIWTINRPLTANGSPIVGRSRDGSVWQRLVMQATTNDIGFHADTTFVAGTFGIRYTTTGENPTLSFQDQVKDTLTFDNFERDTVTAIEIQGPTVCFSSTRGVAISRDHAKSFRIFRGNPDSLMADVAFNYTFANTINLDSSTFGLTGDWIPAMAIRPGDQSRYRIWVSSRPTTKAGEFNGITTARYVETGTGPQKTYKLRWEPVYGDGFAWNFGFNGDSVFAATNAGLLMYREIAGQAKWDTIRFVNSSGDTLVGSDRAVYSVRAIDTLLWVGTENGTVVMNLRDFRKSWVNGVVDSTNDVYAFPVPFSPNEHESVSFHFPVTNPSGSRVTIEVYDFAMELVATVFSDQFFPKGLYQGRYKGVPEWNGRNGDGRLVAVGVYYFKVKYSNDGVRWGKLAVIP